MIPIVAISEIPKPLVASVAEQTEGTTFGLKPFRQYDTSSTATFRLLRLIKKTSSPKGNDHSPESNVPRSNLFFY